MNKTVPSIYEQGELLNGFQLLCPIKHQKAPHCDADKHYGTVDLILIALTASQLKQY